MRTFSELLREYIGRTGISDAELARAIGVQRQTVFRWKEGLVSHPRSAEEVLGLAKKLRLTPEERDELLLAGGFPPVAAPVRAELAHPPGSEPAAEPAKIDVPQHTRAPEPEVEALLPEVVAPVKPRSRRFVAALAGVCALVLIAAAIFAVMRDRQRYPQAAPGQTLIVIAQFGNYTGGNQGYNVAGRLNEALERELKAAGLQDAATVTWPDPVTDPQSAARVVAASGARLLIWGEYDSGRLVARFLPRDPLATSSRELSLLAASPSELPAVINSALPVDIRYLSLYTLAQIYLDERQPAAARAALGQAGLALPADPATRAAHYFLWGYANSVMTPPDLDAAIQGYTDALKLDDGLDAAHNNRAVAYLARRGPGDLAAAVDDLTRYLAKHADDAAAYNNRGSAYFLLGGGDHLAQAIADFDRAIAIAPSDSAGYYNRGLAYIRLDDGPKWRTDLERALAAGNPGAQAGLCWGYSLSDEPQKAIDHCREAIKTAKDAGPWENLGVACARAGQPAEAISALEAYRERLAAEGGPAAKIERADEWVRALKAGRNPIDAGVVKGLREE